MLSNPRLHFPTVAMDKEKTGGKRRMKKVSQIKKERYMKQSRAPEVRGGIKEAEEWLTL